MIVRWMDRHAGVLLVGPALGILALFAFYPIVGSFWLSLHRIVLSLPGVGEPFVGLANYAELAQGSVFWRSVGVTLLFVGVSTALEVALGLGLALCLHASFRGRGLARAIALVPWAIPTVVASQMWRFLLNDRFGPVAYYLFGGGAPLAEAGSALASIIAADVWKTTSFVALIVLAGLQAIPDDLYEAAAVDGAGPFRRFRSVTLPLVLPALLAAVLFRTIDAFRVFDLVFVMTQGGPADATNVLQYMGYKRMFGEGMLGSGAAISTVVFGMTLVASIAYVRIVGSRLLEGSAGAR